MASKIIVVAFILVAVAHAVPIAPAKPVPENNLATTLNTGAVRAIELLQSQGMDDSACRSEAQLIINGIIHQCNSSQIALNSLTSGEECAILGQEEVSIARETKRVAIERHETAKLAVKTTFSATVTLSSRSFSMLLNEGCDWIQTDEAYLIAKQHYEAAVSEESEASVAVNLATKALEFKIIEAAELKKACECQVQTDHVHLWTGATSRAAASLAAWQQAQRMICVLDSEFNATHKLTKCTYPEPPKHVKPFIVPDAENQVCQIAPNIVGVCNIDSLTGEEYYALEESTLNKNDHYCYHVKVGSEAIQGHIGQDHTDVAADGHTCNKENFSRDQEVGTHVSKVSDTEQLYTLGTAQYCESGKARQGQLKISQDPAVESTTAVAVEKSSCNYDVTITVSSCGQKHVEDMKDWRVEPRKTISDTVTSSGEVTSTSTSTPSSSTTTTSSSTTSSGTPSSSTTTTSSSSTSSSTSSTTSTQTFTSTTSSTQSTWTAYTTPMIVENGLPLPEWHPPSPAPFAPLPEWHPPSPAPVAPLPEGPLE